MQHRRPFVITVAFVIAANSVCGEGARAQEILQSALGSARNDHFGAAVAFGPDLDGDGFREVAVGAPDVNTTVHHGGAVYVLSGRDFSRIETIVGTVTNGIFGNAVCWCGDVDGDGLADLAIGAPGYGVSGTVAVHSSSTWNRLRLMKGTPNFPDGFGSALADGGDANGDGVDDLLVGAPWAIANGPDSGSMFLYSGADGSLLWSVDGAAYSALGRSVAAVGDVNGDGFVDFAVGEPWHDGAAIGDYSGVVEVYSGADQTVLQSWTGSSSWYYFSYYPGWAGDYLGIAVGAAGDFDNDGVPDVWAASSQGVTTGGGYVSIFSGATGATLRTMVCVGTWQVDASTIGDVNGDGLPEFVSVGVAQSSHVVVFSSFDGKVLWQIDANVFPGGFSTVAGDRLTTTDFLFGMAYNSDAALYAGKVELRATNDLWLDVAPTHFPIAGDTLSFTAAEGPTGNLAMLALTDVNGTPLFIPLTFTTFDAAGAAALLTATIPPGLTGTTLKCHAFAIGAGGKVADSIDELITLL